MNFLLFLFLFGLLSSQSLIDLFATLISFTVIYKLIKEPKNTRLPKLGLEKFFGAWLLVISAGLLVNLQPETPWIKNFFEFRWMLELYFFTTAISLVNPKEKDLEKLLYPILFASGFAVLVYFLRYDPITESWADRVKHLHAYRTGGLFSNPMPLAHSYGMIAMLLLGPMFLYGKKEFQKNKLWVGTAFLTLMAVFLTFTRGIWIGMTAAVIVMGFLVDWKRGFKILGGTVLVLTLLFVLVSPFRQRVLFSMNPQKTYDSERLTIWRTNFEIFKEHPILGLGYSENSRRIREYYDKTGVPRSFHLESHAHNQYLHFLAGTGLLGLGAYLFLIFWMFRIQTKAYFLLRKNQERFFAGVLLGIIGAEICFYVAGFTESNFSIAKNRYLMVLLWSLGCWLWLKSRLRFQ